MTDTTSKRQFQLFCSCAEEAPSGAYEVVKSLRSVIGDSVDMLIRNGRILGLKVDNCDGAFALETAIYSWFKQANPDSTLFPAAEGFGESMEGQARDRVLQQTADDTALLAALGVTEKQA